MGLPVIDHERIERLSIPPTKPMELGNMIALGLIALCVLYLIFRRRNRKTSKSS